MMMKSILRNAFAALFIVGGFSIPIAVAMNHMGGRGGMHMMGDSEFLFAAPADASEAWVRAKGGLIYDNWWEALNRPKPNSTHPAYPKSGKESGAVTWRCKECHGWDYKGKDGKYAGGSHATGIKGIRAAAGRDPKEIVKLVRAAPHRYTPSMIGDAALERLAIFVSRGQHDTDAYIDDETGDVRGGAVSRAEFLERGRGIYQTTCAACHGFDGRRFNFGDNREPVFVGTEARSNPWEVLHKIRNGHPGAEMINLRAFAMADSAALVGYARTLPSR
jgi:thiosulfate dehydrogenase